MKVKLLKNHILGSKDDVIEVTDEQANYLNRVKAAIEHKEDGDNEDANECQESEELESDEVTEAGGDLFGSEHVEDINDTEGITENVEILSDMVDDETKNILIEDAAKEGIEIEQEGAVQTADPVAEKEEKSTHNTKEDKGATHRKTK